MCSHKTNHSLLDQSSQKRGSAWSSVNPVGKARNQARTPGALSTMKIYRQLSQENLTSEENGAKARQWLLLHGSATVSYT